MQMQTQTQVQTTKKVEGPARSSHPRGAIFLAIVSLAALTDAHEDKAKTKTKTKTKTVVVQREIHVPVQLQKQQR